MAARLPYQTTAEEKLVWFSLILTYVFFTIGSTYGVGCVVGWMSFGICMLRTFIHGKPANGQIPIIIWCWILSMFVMLIALLMAHAEQDLGLGKTIKSSIGWAKGWALLALFPMPVSYTHLTLPTKA